jgi:hypothetical protein
LAFIQFLSRMWDFTLQLGYERPQLSLGAELTGWAVTEASLEAVPQW